MNARKSAIALFEKNAYTVEPRYKEVGYNKTRL